MDVPAHDVIKFFGVVHAFYIDSRYLPNVHWGMMVEACVSMSMSASWSLFWSSEVVAWNWLRMWRILLTFPSNVSILSTSSETLTVLVLVLWLGL